MTERSQHPGKTIGKAWQNHGKAFNSAGKEGFSPANVVMQGVYPIFRHTSVKNIPAHSSSVWPKASRETIEFQSFNRFKCLSITQENSSLQPSANLYITPQKQTLKHVKQVTQVLQVLVGGLGHFLCFNI